MSRDAALDVLHGLVTDLPGGPRWGEIAVHWQRADAAAVLDPGHVEKLHWLGRPKGGSKSTDAAGFSLAWLMEQAPPLAEGFAVAADEDQANRLLNKARGFVARTSELRGVRVEAHRIVGPNGATVTTLAADVAGSEGLLTPFVVVDELPNWASTPTARGMWTSVISSVPKWPGARLVVIGHAGDPSHWSYKVLERARRSRAWRVVEIPGPLEWLDPAALEEQRGLLSLDRAVRDGEHLLPSEYSRRFLNQWTAGEDQLATSEDVRECVGHVGVLPPEPGRRYAMTLDIGLRRDRSVLAVGHLERVKDRAKVVIDRLFVWKGSRRTPVDLAEVEEAALLASRAYNGAPLVFDPYQAAQLSQGLTRRGVRTVEHTFSQASINRLARTLYQLLSDHLLDLPADDELLAELERVKLVEVSAGLYRIDHESGEHDDQAIAVAMLAEHLLSERPSTMGRYQMVPAGGWEGRGATMRVIRVEDAAAGDHGERARVKRMIRALQAGDVWSR